MKTLRLLYDKAGHGDLEVLEGTTVLASEKARTGSVNDCGLLVHAIPTGQYVCNVASMDTTEEGMNIGPGAGWKVRMYSREGKRLIYDGFCIHPDGGKGGTLGCIGLSTTAYPMRHAIDSLIEEQGELVVNVVAEGMD